MVAGAPAPPPTARAPRRRAAARLRGGGAKAASGVARRVEHGADDREAVRARSAQLVGPASEADDRQREHGAQRDADRLAVERIGRARGEQRSRRRRRRRRCARSRPGCRRRPDPRRDDQPRAVGESRAARRRSPIARQPRWTWKPAMPSSTPGGRRRPGRRRRARARRPWSAEARRRHAAPSAPQAAREQPAHHALALGDEAAARGVEVALLELPVVGDARIVGVQDVDAAATQQPPG